MSTNKEIVNSTIGRLEDEKQEINQKICARIYGNQEICSQAQSQHGIDNKDSCKQFQNIYQQAIHDETLDHIMDEIKQICPRKPKDMYALVEGSNVLFVATNAEVLESFGSNLKIVDVSHGIPKGLKPHPDLLSTGLAIIDPNLHCSEATENPWSFSVVNPSSQSLLEQGLVCFMETLGDFAALTVNGFMDGYLSRTSDYDKFINETKRHEEREKDGTDLDYEEQEKEEKQMEQTQGEQIEQIPEYSVCNFCNFQLLNRLFNVHITLPLNSKQFYWLDSTSGQRYWIFSYELRMNLNGSVEKLKNFVMQTFEGL